MADDGDDVRRVDVFVTAAWGGQPVTIRLHDGSLAAAAMAAAAQQSDSIETAFVDTTGQVHEMRVFRSGREVPFSGAAALAAAWALQQQWQDPGGLDSVHLSMPLGDVHVSCPENTAAVEPLWLEAPMIGLGAPWPTAQIHALLGLQLPPDLRLPPVQMASLAQPILLVPVPGLAELGTCRLDGPAFRGFAVRMVRHQALHLQVYAFCLQARSENHHVAARMFRPADNGPEEAASCEAAACLGAYLLQHKLLPDGTELLIEQGYETGRPSLLRLRVQMQMEGPRIEVGGHVRPHFDDDNSDREMLPR